MSIGK